MNCQSAELALEVGSVNAGLTSFAAVGLTVFAAGDCTSQPNSYYGRRVRLESVSNALEQAQAAAVAMLGR